jgi:hypothetical protein
MAAVFAFLGMLLISIVVGLLAALQFGDFFGANDEFALVLGCVLLLAAAALSVFAAAYGLTRSAQPLSGVALALAVAAFWPLVLPGAVARIASHSTNPYTVGIENTYIALELVVPSLLIVLVQWGLVRKRWLRAAAQDDFTLWPWFSTALAALVMLNPIGLTFLWDTIRHSRTDILWELTATVTGGVLCFLLVMVGIECYIRERILRRRTAALPPAASNGTVRPDRATTET